MCRIDADTDALIPMVLGVSLVVPIASLDHDLVLAAVEVALHNTKALAVTK